MRQDRLFTLDAMRGVAAILVVLFHMTEYGFLGVPNGGLAVDFFFALSGVVIALTYEKRLRSGTSAKQFLIQRTIRLYPMYGVGFLIGVAKAAGQIVFGAAGALSPPQFAVAFCTGLFLLPSPLSNNEIFPLNVPAWSLCLELLANVAFAFLLFRMSNRKLGALVALLAVAYAGFAVAHGSTTLGFTWATLPGGIIRTIFGFGLGVFFARLNLCKPVSSGLSFTIPIVALCALLCWPKSAHFELPFDLVAVFMACPFLLWLGGRLAPPRALEGACEVLGLISYPLYAIHFPALSIIAFIAGKLHIPLLVWGPISVVGLLLTSYGLGRLLDPAIRAGLTSFFGERRPRVATT
jgi:peptidoglycan/LPS O-acetylase OafA/YrhL